LGPSQQQGQKLPVMVWTYGGGFAAGSKSQNTPEGLFNLTTEFIFVAYNYRLGLTGIANGPTLLHEGGISNTGLWDAQHAFQWVNKYICAFGGDPEQITAVGFSAGASVVLFQLTVSTTPRFYLPTTNATSFFQRFAGHNEQLFSRAYVKSPGFVPGAGHEHAEVNSYTPAFSINC
jgi:carboxylesterase type B